jgi:hypothetical protein
MSKQPPDGRGKRPRDPIAFGHWLIEQTAQATGETPENPPPPQPAKNPAAVALSKLGASKGGKARAASLSKKKRAEIAKKAAAARWNKTKS